MIRTMHRLSRPDGLHLDLTMAQAQAQATHGTPRDRVSMSPSFSLVSAPFANPDPAYIAASAASQIVTSEHAAQNRDLPEGRATQSNTETAGVSPASLNLVNSFLDRLLFNFLSSARSTSLASLRLAVVEVLKPRLAKDAITGADEELHEFLGGGDDEELLAFHNGQEPSSEFDLDLVWKRTRLRCMVYTRLGDMEEEDEEMYIEQEHLQDTGDSRRVSRELGIVSPAVAIFLTSILEFIGEQALTIAGDAAYRRAENEIPRVENRRLTLTRRVIVEEIDMEKVAFNTTLGRLWRAWRRLVRSPNHSISRHRAHDSVGFSSLRSISSNSASRKSSVSIADGQFHESDFDLESPAVEVLMPPEPESIPLPSTDHDIAEIEVPGYSPLAVRRIDGLSIKENQHRPYSSVVTNAQVGSSTFTSSSSRPQTPTAMLGFTEDAALPPRCQRSHSLPTPIQTPFVLAPEYQLTGHNGASPPESPMIRLQEVEVPLIRQQEAPEVDSHESFRTPVSGPSDGTSNSMPTTPFQGSVLNAISRHAARELRDAPSDLNPEGSYPKLYASQAFEPHDPKSLSVSSIDNPRDTWQTRYSPSKSVQSFAIGEVSPMVDEFSLMEPSAIDWGEVSPIDTEEEQLYPIRRPASDNDPLPIQGNSNHLNTAIPDHQQPFDAHETANTLADLYSIQGRQRRVDGPTEEDFVKDEKREAYVVQDEQPSSQSARSSDGSMLSGKDLQLDGTISSTRLRPPGAETGAPPLTPLREMLEAAHDTSDESSSLGPSQSEGMQFGGRTTSLASSTYSQTHKPSNGAKKSDTRRQLPAVYTGNGIDRAAVQRVSPSPKSAREPSTPQGRRSESSTRDVRSTYNSASGVSPVAQKLKGLVVNPQSRSSSDGSRSAADDKHNMPFGDSSNKQKSFDQLIKSDETIQYTLTPQNMREMEAPSSPRWSSFKRSNNADAIEFVGNKGPSSVLGSSQLPVSRTAGLPPKGPNGLRSNPSDAKPKSISDVKTIAAPTKPTFQKTSIITTKREGQPVPRDARIGRGVTRDFADFIKSTGPEQFKSSPEPPRSSTVSRPTTGVGGSLRSPGSVKSANSSPRTLIKSPTGFNSKKNEAKISKKPTVRLQAREATINRSDESSDLIDFIRQGPPVDHSNGEHRIPRTVAPFRNTMDSDDISSLGNGRGKETSSISSAQESYLQTKSLHSSVNSRTGLLDSTNRSNVKLGSSSSFDVTPRADEPPHPMRKQRRVKDPYAIDYDSDGDDEAMHTPKPRREEESMLDFLNSEPAPSHCVNIPSAFDDMPPRKSSGSGKTLQRKVSAPSMRARFTRGSSAGTAIQGEQVASSSHISPASLGSPARNGVQQNSPNRPQQASPQFVAQFNTRSDTFNPVQSNYPPQINPQRNRQSQSTVRQIQPRVERNEVNNMRDLADFLKNSGPPEIAPARLPSATKEESGFSRMFSRRKKSAGVS